MFVYEDLIKKSLFGLKFFKQTWIGKVFGKLLAEYYATIDFEVVNLVIPVPLHWLRYYKRGYNQAEVIATSFCKNTGLPLGKHILRRCRHTRPQKELTDQERMQNLMNAFSINARQKKQIRGKKILLIDDIYTTGTTIDYCSKLLYENGAESVSFLTIAIGNGM